MVDTGIGISKETQVKLFERFTQADSSTSRRYGGSGLGLSIVKAIVERQGGRLTVESRPGRTVFEMTMPRPAFAPSD